MENHKKIKQFLVLLFAIVVLFFITQENQHSNKVERINKVSEINLLNEKEVDSKELFLDCYKIIKHNYYNHDLNKQDFSKWKKRYLSQIEDEQDAYVAINSMLMSLNDPYSKFLSKEEFSKQNSAINSKLYGIGINIASIAGKISIINVLENTPADTMGLKAGDVILKINDEPLQGESIYKAAQLIRGDINKPVTFEILRGSKKYTKIIKRAEINIKTVESKKLSSDIGYIRVSSFIGAQTPKEFIIALNRLNNTKGLIIDLRGNSGGLFQNAIVMSNLFLKKGTIVNVIARQNKKNTYKAQNKGCIYDNPIAILIDGNSASASEIFASSLHDNKRAVLFGTKSYGKGLVQKIFSMPNQTGMNLTIAKYLTADNIDINNIGVEPDYTVNINRNDFINNIDTQLAEAKKYLEKELLK